MKNRNFIFLFTFFFSGIYGIQGTGTTSTTPGARYYASSWIDSNGNLWMFGGQGFDSSSSIGEFVDSFFLISQRNRK